MNNGAFGENFPYSNFHDLNMDWIIKIAKDFLDQYTHIQQVIADGETSLTNLTTEGLQQLQEKADNLTELLQAWYNEHSEDIANQLTNALADLNDWYNTHANYLNQTLATNIALFDAHAEEKAEETIASIPDDYTTLSDRVSNVYTWLDTTTDVLYGGEDVKGQVISAGWSIFLNVEEGDIVHLAIPAHSAVMYNSTTPSTSSFVRACNPSGVYGIRKIIIPEGVKGIGINYIGAWEERGEVGYRIEKTAISVPMNLHWEVGGMDDGHGNNRFDAIHTIEYLEILGNSIGLRHSGTGVVYQYFNSAFEYLSYDITTGTTGTYTRTPPANAKYIKICLFSPNGSLTIGDNSYDVISAYDLGFVNMKRLDYAECGTVLSTAYKASAVSSNQVLYTRDGEGTLFEIQLIGAYATTSTPPFAFWANFYRNVLTITVDGEVAVQGSIYDLCGLGSEIISDAEYADGIYQNILLDTPLFSKGGKYSGIIFKFQIPYYESIEVRVTGTSGTMWGIIKTYTKFNVKIDGVQIPYGAKFYGKTAKNEAITKGEQLTLMNSSKNGALLGINLSGESTGFDWVEGCLRMFRFGATTQENCQMLSSGIEDYMGGAFGYNVGENTTPTYGATMVKMTANQRYRLSGYRNHFDAPIMFTYGGFKVTCRWGDQNKANWNLSNTDNFAGHTGEPGTGKLVGTAFYYEW